MNDFQNALQRCLDDGLDPLDDITVHEHLAAHPEDLEAFATLTASLRALQDRASIATAPAAPALGRGSFRRRVAAAAAAAVVLLGAGTFVTLCWSHAAPTMPPPPRIDPRGRFLAASCSVPQPQPRTSPPVHTHVVSDHTWQMPPATDSHRSGTFAVAVVRMQSLEE